MKGVSRLELMPQAVHAALHKERIPAADTLMPEERMGSLR